MQKKDLVRNRLPLQKTVLVVDDVDYIRRPIKWLIEGIGKGQYEAVTASNAMEAVEEARNQKFHLILVDWGLPDHHGDWLINEIRNDTLSENRNTVILVQTANIEICQNECLGAGANYVYSKTEMLCKGRFSEILQKWLYTPYAFLDNMPFRSTTTADKINIFLHQ